jgi:hypothetical protein
MRREMAERWYDRLSVILEHDLSSRQPLLIALSLFILVIQSS